MDVSELPVCDKGLMNGTYSIPHGLYCDRFYACQNGTPYLMQCEDGFGYKPYQGCKLLHEVNCANRTKLQEPHGSGACPRLYGLYRDPKGCGKYISCYNGTAVSGTCPQSLVFSENEKVCRQPTEEEKKKCQPEPVLIGCTVGPDNSNHGACTWYQCPALDVLPFGDHSRHSYPGHCQYYIMCLRDGTIKIGSCDKGMGFNPVSMVCEPESAVKECHSPTVIQPHPVVHSGMRLSNFLRLV